jgi:hypothetical protein
MQAMDRARIAGLLACIGIGLVGCPASSPGPKPAKKDAGAYDAGSDDAGVYCPPGTPTFALERDTPGTGNVIAARLFDAMPNPPDHFDNIWTVDFVDAEGKPVQDIQIRKAEARMPFHTGHPPRPALGVTKMPEPGRFKVRLFLQMPGYFVISLKVSSASLGADAGSDVEDEILFPYCLE